MENLGNIDFIMELLLYLNIMNIIILFLIFRYLNGFIYIKILTFLIFDNQKKPLNMLQLEKIWTFLDIEFHILTCITAKTMPHFCII